MGPNLLEATNDYWRKLDELNTAYYRGDISLEEVDAQVKALMTELGQARREYFRHLMHGFRQTWDTQRELMLGCAFLTILAYGWFVFN